MKNSIVLTTINKLNINIKKLVFLSQQNDSELIVIGDKKTPKNFNLKYGNFYNIKDQKKLKFDFSKICPLNSYSRKNIGYLIAIQNRSNTIIETDDDNYPKNNFLKFLDLKHNVKEIKEIGWTNIYTKFVKKNLIIWPRGLPLSKINKCPTYKKKKVIKNFYLKQGVCEGNPDVDAIYRIINNNINIKFKKNYKFSLGKSFSPINSQNTIWNKKIFPLMYLPVTCTMRATDIWRGLIALNIINNDNLSVLFFGTTMKQNRNFHIIENDLKDELPLYKSIESAFEILHNLKLKKGSQNYVENLLKSYENLVKNKIFNEREIYYLKSWIKDINKFGSFT